MKLLFLILLSLVLMTGCVTSVAEDMAKACALNNGNWTYHREWKAGMNDADTSYSCTPKTLTQQQ